MCGLAGAFNSEQTIEAILQHQHHRGPDAKSVCSIELASGATLQLGHNRLKIICLDDVANQPLIDETKHHYLIFNGEIYNYLEIKEALRQQGVVFTTTSDTEVLLRALIHQGMDALQQLNGMFAFAYFNKHTQRLYLVRDRFGVKPLYYHWHQQRLMFASSTKILADMCHLKPNYDYLKRGLQFGIYEDDSDISAYQGLKAVRAGHCVEFNLHESPYHMREHRYYDLSQNVLMLTDTLQSQSLPQQLESIACALDDAIKVRLRVDVPMTVTLSGGLDSATVAAVAKKHSTSLHAFCFGNLDDPHSESRAAQSIADFHAIELHHVDASPQEWMNAFWQTLHYQDAPFAGLSIVAQNLLYQMIHRHGFKVALGGQGGDEAFLGYRKFQFFYLNALLKQHRWFAAASFMLSLSQMLWAEKSRWQHLLGASRRYTVKQGQLTGLMLPGHPVELNMGLMASVQERQVADVLQYSLPTLLRYDDRNSMAHSIESRLPFLDYRLMELACALPPALKIKRGYGKWPIRSIMKHELPRHICFQRNKKGFDISSSQVIYKALEPSLNQHFDENKHEIRSLIKGDAKEYFNPFYLATVPSRFTELTTLLWLLKQ